jgi:hypothetical protein
MPAPLTNPFNSYLDADAPVTPLWLMSESEAAKWWEQKYGGNPPGGEPTAAGERKVSGTRFATAVEKSIGPVSSQNIEQMFVAAGVDTDEPVVQGYLQKAISDMNAADSQDEAVQVMSQVQAYLPAMAAKYPAVPATAYDQALAASGLEDVAPRPPSVARGRYEQIAGHAPPPGTMDAKFVRSEETGWVRYVGGVLVDPNVPLGSPGAVIFAPDSTAPGSALWLAGVDKWDESKVEEWKKRLAEYGYLTKDQSKVEGVDLLFKDALSRYHQLRYQNGGKPLATDLSGAAGGGAEYNLTAKDFQVEIRNDVREQWRQTFGGDPSDAELENWTRFVTRTSLRAQRNFTHRGVPSTTAASLAATRAEETLVEELQTSPEAVQLRESTEENTSLRDALAGAVVATRSLAG